MKRWEGVPLSKEAKVLTGNLLKRGEFKLQKISRLVLKLSPAHIEILTKALSGHNCLNYHLYNMGYSYTQNCEYCTNSDQESSAHTEKLETARHILCECPAFTSIRAQIYYNHYIDENEVFNGSLLKGMNNLIQFFKKTKCLSRTPNLKKEDLSPKRTWRKKRKEHKIKPNNSRKCKQQKITSYSNIK